MEDFSKEIMGYALQNALEFGKADPSKILPKLFQHGLQKEDIKATMPLIIEAVKKVNGMKEHERGEAFELVKKKINTHEREERKGLPELPNASKHMVLRIAPFPSGALHIGNAKTFLLNTLYAEKYNAKLLLIIDDTIGSEEKQPLKEGYKLIEEAAKLLGVNYHKPIIYKSDRLSIYYEYAKKLIDKGAAYVCHCPQETLRENRAQGIECQCRQFPSAIQQARWKDMFGEPEGHAVLRLKTNMQDPNPAFRDRVLFKIADRPHPRVGKKYRIWPTLEMSWAVDDHVLGITHILRGNDLMIETDMEKYMWDIFGWKHPETLHSGLIKIEGAEVKLSKSKAQKEVREGTFTGWDDPRTWSIQSLIRRGIRKEAIRSFVEEIGLNKQDITVPIESLYAHNRKFIDAEAPRFYALQNPIELALGKELGTRTIKIPIHPDTPEKTRNVPLKKIYMAQSDYEAHKGKEIRLLHLCNVMLVKTPHITSYENKKIPRVQWVSDHVPIRILMPDGTWKEAVAEKAITKLKKGAPLQFERIGFVRYDKKNKDHYEFWFSHA